MSTIMSIFLFSITVDNVYFDCVITGIAGDSCSKNALSRTYDVMRAKIAALKIADSVPKHSMPVDSI